MNHALLFLLLAGFYAAETGALTITETFQSRAHYASGAGGVSNTGAIWNQELHVVHPTLNVMNYETPFVPLEVSVGDGSDGPFDNTTYVNFSAGGDVTGNIIRLDTTVHPVLNVTHFALDPLWTIEPVGTAPLIIKSLSYVRILGTIQCSGHDGGDASGATGGTGGAGRCGGKSGGDGGSSVSGGSDGGDASGSVTGGRGGNFVAASFVGGGGGGSWSQASPPGDGPNSSGAGGGHGSYHSDPEFSTIAGSAGGGGGSGDGISGGGGGGGGGGVVIIHAVGALDLGTNPASVTGSILVDGGNGGNSGGSGGPGGGGGGGSVQVFVGDIINFYNTDPSGASQAAAGTGGSGGAAGAAGGLGRSWFSSVNGTSGGGVYSPLEEFPVNSGDVEFDPGTGPTFENVITKSYDMLNNFGTVSSLQFSSLVPADVTLEIAGSSDNFVTDNTGWSTDPASVAGKRYLKLRITIHTSNIFSPTVVSSVSFVFTPGSPDIFRFRTAGCGRVDHGGPENLWLLLLAPLMLLILKFQAHRKLSRNR